MTGNKLQPALLGGLFIGVLSALPVVNWFNCCCLWVLGGGMLSAYLLQQSQPTAIEVADGALVGLLAGIFGGILGVILAIPLAEYTRNLFEQVLGQVEGVPDEWRSALEGYGTGPALLGFRFFFAAVVGAIFGMLGGLLGAAIFKKGPQPSPPGTIDVPPGQ